MPVLVYSSRNPEDMGSVEEDRQDDFTISGDVLVLVYSSIGPEDSGSDEEDLQVRSPPADTPALVYLVTE